MVKWLVAASLAWPVLLGSAVWARLGADSPGWTNLVYLAGAPICHQRPDRSFHTDGVKWPVCARCSGLYLAAPVGSIAGLLSLRRRLRLPRGLAWRTLVLAGAPTAATVGIEWLGLAAPSNLVRALAALPLGAAVAFVLIQTAAGTPEPIE
jgi:uncharacterized membrane protein